MLMETPQLENLGSLITIAGTNTALGYLIDFKQHGVYSPDGRVDVSPADAQTHNRLLDEALLKGLDERCEVGQGGTFYYTKGEVRTFCGVTVSASILRTGQRGQVLTFKRNGKFFRGVLPKDGEAFNFKRIS